MTKAYKVVFVVFLLYVFFCGSMLFYEYYEIARRETAHFNAALGDLRAVEVPQITSKSVTRRISAKYIAVPWLEKSGGLTNAPFPHRASSTPHPRIRYSPEDLKREPDFWLPIALLVPLKIVMIFCGGIPFIILIIFIDDQGRKIPNVLNVLTFIGTVAGIALYIFFSKQVASFYLDRYPLSQNTSKLEFVFGSGSMQRKFIIFNPTDKQVFVYANDRLVGQLREKSYDYFSIIKTIRTITLVMKSTGAIIERTSLVPVLTPKSSGYYIYNIGERGTFWIEDPPNYIVLPGL